MSKFKVGDEVYANAGMAEGRGEVVWVTPTDKYPYTVLLFDGDRIAFSENELEEVK